jgi:thioredoxin reductase (NADPH)
VFFNVESVNINNKIKEQYDIVIIGGGPAGLSAALYGVQGGVSVLVLEKALEGGQMNTTDVIENYPGFASIKGEELSTLMKGHAEKFGAEFYSSEVVSMEFKDDLITTKLDDGNTVKSRVLIVASGSKPKKLNVKGEKEFASKGVSYCASCDGHFFKNMKVAVIGGGNSAVEEAVYLSNIAKEVYIIHRRDKLRADKLYQDRAFSRNNIKFKWNSVVEEIKGDLKVKSLVIRNTVTNEVYEEEFDGVFIFIGILPETSFLPKGFFETDEYGFIITDETMLTNINRVYAAGDVRHKDIRQIVTAVSDGAIAASNAIRKYLNI